MHGIALLTNEIPRRIFDEVDLERRVFDRGGNVKEIRFLWDDPDPLLPVIDGGVFRLVRWGSRAERGALPCTGFTWRATVDEGRWSSTGCETQLVKIPATYGVDKGIWYKITEGCHGLLVRHPVEGIAVYLICEPPTRYYRVMTRSERMPWLIDEVI